MPVKMSNAGIGAQDGFPLGKKCHQEVRRGLNILHPTDGGRIFNASCRRNAYHGGYNASINIQNQAETGSG
jgi:hypothetical protein